MRDIAAVRPYPFSLRHHAQSEHHANGHATMQQTARPPQSVCICTLHSVLCWRAWQRKESRRPQRPTSNVERLTLLPFSPSPTRRGQPPEPYQPGTRSMLCSRAISRKSLLFPRSLLLYSPPSTLRLLALVEMLPSPRLWAAISVSGRLQRPCCCCVPDSVDFLPARRARSFV